MLENSLDSPEASAGKHGSVLPLTGGDGLIDGGLGERIVGLRRGRFVCGKNKLAGYGGNNDGQKHSS
jgi:hypothetical protein